MNIKINKKQVKNILLNIFYPVLAFSIVLSVWAIVASLKNNPLLLPMPGEVIEKFFTLCKEDIFWASVGNTLWCTIYTFFISFIIALIFASLSGIFEPLYKVFAPIVSFLRAAPTVAVILVLYAFLDIKSLSAIVGFLVAFPILYNGFFNAIQNVDKGLLDMAKIYKLSKKDVIFNVYLKEITPTLFNLSKATLSLTLKVIIAAEILTFVPRSIGMKIQTASASFDVVYLLAWTLIAILFSFVLEVIVSILKVIWERTR